MTSPDFDILIFKVTKNLFSEGRLTYLFAFRVFEMNLEQAKNCEIKGVLSSFATWISGLTDSQKVELNRLTNVSSLQY